MSTQWPVGDPRFEPLYRDLLAAVRELLAAYDAYCNHGLAKLEDAANEDCP
jgi:hypothetical protein